MKKPGATTIGILAASTSILAGAVGGYIAYVNQKVNSKNYSDTKMNENLFFSATVTNQAGKAICTVPHTAKLPPLLMGKGDYILLTYDQPITFNTIILKEALLKIGSLAYLAEGGTKRFSVFAEKDGAYELVYRNDKIDAYRLCYCNSVTTSSLKIKVDDCRGTTVLREVGIYNLAPKKQDFQVIDYLSYQEDVDYSTNENFRAYAKTVTDIILFPAVSLDANGAIFYPNGKESFLQKVNEIKAGTDELGVDLHCEVFAGNERKSFFEKNIDTIATNIAAFATEFDFAGVDMDWEYPRNREEWAVYDRLVIAVHEALEPLGKKIAIAIAVWNVAFSEEARNAVDYFNVMVYDHLQDDYNAYHATFKQATLAVERLIYKGYDRKKICLGSPYYGRETRENRDIGPMWMNYRESTIDNPWQNVDPLFHVQGVDKYDDTTQVTYFNGYAMIRDKTAYAIAMGLGGVMGFSMDIDKTMDSPLALHRAVEEVVKNRLCNEG